MKPEYDLIGLGVEIDADLLPPGVTRMVVIPSALFVAKAEETRRQWDVATGGPLPPS